LKCKVNDFYHYKLHFTYTFFISSQFLRNLLHFCRMKLSFLISLFIALFLGSCEENSNQQLPESLPEELWVEMLVEIPAGTIEKYELNKDSGQLQIDSVDGKPRLIEYLGYPGNYGMIKETILPKDMGGDGDPLDVIAIGPPAERGSIVTCKVIGVLKLKDNGEQDDKLIAVSRNSSLQHIQSISELQANYPGISEIIETWFTNYKGQGKMLSKGFQEKKMAQEIYSKAKQSYEKQAK